MSKLPWFKFFPVDWLGGTRTLTAVETGVYITLIATMYDRGHPLTDTPDQLARLCGARLWQFNRALETLVTAGKILRFEGGLWNTKVELECTRPGTLASSTDAAIPGTLAPRQFKAKTKEKQRPEFTYQKTEPEDRSQKLDLSDGVTRARDLETMLREAAGWLHEPAPKLCVTGPIQALIDNGADLDLDVLPIVKAIALKANPTGWNYFIKPIARARDDRLAAAIIINPTPGSSHGTYRRPHAHNSLADSFAVADAVVDEAIRRSEECGEENIVRLPGLWKGSA